MAVLEDPRAEPSPAHGLDRRAFEAIVRAHQGSVLAFCLRRCADASVARDVAQEVFLTLWRERARYQDRARVRAYLFAIARFRCLADGKRAGARRRLEAVVEAQPPPISLDPAEAVERRAARTRLEAGLATLDAERAEIVRLRFIDELTPDEIAEVLGVKVGTVKSRLHRGLADLRKELAGER